MSKRKYKNNIFRLGYLSTPHLIRQVLIKMLQPSFILLIFLFYILFTNIASSVSIGDTITIGLGSCGVDYEFFGFNEQNNTISIVNIETNDEVILEYENSTGVIEYIMTVENHTLEYLLRYDTENEMLDVLTTNLPCPLDSCSINSDCDDGYPCTRDTCEGTPKRCKNAPLTICSNASDLCCPAGCNDNNDIDCSASNECTSHKECNDNNTCTIDACAGHPLMCVNIRITDCYSGDSCCPQNCSYSTDNDCSRPIICGDGFCEGNEINSSACCEDCGCSINYECKNNKCIESALYRAEKRLNKDKKFSTQTNNLLSKGYILEDKKLVETFDGVDYKYTYKKEDDVVIFKGKVDFEEDKIIRLSPRQSPFLLYIVIVIVVMAPVALIIFKKTKKKTPKTLPQQPLPYRYPNYSRQRPVYPHQRPLQQRRPIKPVQTLQPAQPYRYGQQRYPQHLQQRPQQAPPYYQRQHTQQRNPSRPNFQK